MGVRVFVGSLRSTVGRDRHISMLAKIGTISKQKAMNFMQKVTKQVTNTKRYTVFTNGGHAGKNWCLVMKARRWRITKNFK